MDDVGSVLFLVFIFRAVNGDGENGSFTVPIGLNQQRKFASGASGICEENAAATITACVIDASHPANAD